MANTLLKEREEVSKMEKPPLSGEEAEPARAEAHSGGKEDKTKQALIKKKKKSLLKRLGEIGTIPQKEVVEFTRHLSVMLGADVTIYEAIEFLKAETKNKIFKNRLESILESLNNGQSLSSAMKKFPKIFPDIYVNIMRVGEQSGTLPQAMTDLADHLEENENFKRKVKGALIYPKIIVTIMIAFILILVLFVMPRILTIFYSLGAEIPLATRIMIKFTEFVNKNVGLIFLIIFGVGIAIHFLLKNEKIKHGRDLFYIKVPLIGQTVLNYNTAQVSQHFGTLFASGITIIKCLEITKSVIMNKIFQEEVECMIDKIKNGSSLSQSFKEKSYFPPMFIKLIRVGERTGKLPHVIEYMKNYYRGLVDSDVKNITTIIEPVIMVMLGLMVAGLIITVIGPIYQLISNVGS
jgi:type IV pilus assembly protein PilC